jgi:hypothetical protein
MKIRGTFWNIWETIAKAKSPQHDETNKFSELARSACQIRDEDRKSRCRWFDSAPGHQ